MTTPADLLEVRTEGRVTVISYSGEKPFSALPENRVRFIEAAAGSKYVVIDIGAHEAFDWNDLYLLLAARRAHRARWGFHMNLFKVVARPGKHRAMIESMHMEHVLSTYRSLREALATFPRRRALHIEPDEEIAAVLELLLEANGFEVIHAASPGKIPPAEKVAGFDIVLTEVEFDGKTDRDLVRRLRVEFGAPVGVLTTRPRERIDGAGFVLGKPVVPDAFLQRVSHALERPLHQYYEAIFDALPVSLAVADGKGRLVRYNRAWGNLFRLPPSEEAGEEIASAFPPDFPGLAALLERLLAVARHAGTEEVPVETAGEGLPERLDFTLTAVGEVGEESHVLLTIAPHPSHEGEIEGDGTTSAAVRTALLSLLEDLDSARADLSGANERLQDLDRMKSDFLSTVSHELRTPIAAIKGSAENLLDGFLGNVEVSQRRTLEVILRNSLRLSRLIENLLDLSRIERGTFEIRRREIDLREAVRLSVEEVQAVAQKSGIRLDIGLPEGSVTLAADADRIGQIVVNLLDNALRFARTRVVIRLEVEAAGARIVVEDDGPGIPQAQCRIIFDRFARLDPHLSHTGLGLSIVQAIAEGHGGKVWAENRAEGGARFIVLLPLTHDMAREAVGAAAKGGER